MLQGTQKYQLQQTLQPDEQMWIDLGKLIREHRPDKNGNALPPDLTSGSYELRDLSNNGVGALFEGKITYDKTYGHAAYGCATCCGYNAAIGWYNPISVPVLDTAEDGVWGYNVCEGDYEDTSTSFYYNWNSGSPSIVTVDSYGTHTGQSVGSATSNTSGQLESTAHYPICPLKSFSPAVTAVVSQRTSGTVSSDDAALSAYQSVEGSANLGAIIGTGPVPGCFIGNEAIGTVTPSNYTGNVIMHRFILNDATYENYTQIAGVTNEDDTSSPSLRDDNPQSGGAAGKVYDLDAPGQSPQQVDTNTYRYRGNFYAYATLPDGTRISPYYTYYVRVSCRKTPSGFQFINDVSNDNKIAAGTTAITWNAQ